MKRDLLQRARQRLDERLSPLRPVERFAMPAKGWLRAVREALGMTRAQFGDRLGIRPQSVADLEESEATAAIQLKTLRRAAEALDCTLVYALVPKAGLEESVRRREREIAAQDLDRVAHSMALEAQGVDDADRDARIERYIQAALRPRDIWDRP